MEDFLSFFFFFFFFLQMQKANAPNKLSGKKYIDLLVSVPCYLYASKFIVFFFFFFFFFFFQG